MLCLVRRPGESIDFTLDGRFLGKLTLGSVYSSEQKVRLLFDFDPAVKIVRPDAVNKEPKARAEPRPAEGAATPYLEMFARLQRGNDPEAKHIEADELLGQALAAASLGLIKKPEAEQILDAYERVEKWYA